MKTDVIVAIEREIAAVRGTIRYLTEEYEKRVGGLTTAINVLEDMKVGYVEYVDNFADYVDSEIINIKGVTGLDKSVTNFETYEFSYEDDEYQSGIKRLRGEDSCNNSVICWDPDRLLYVNRVGDVCVETYKGFYDIEVSGG